MTKTPIPGSKTKKATPVFGIKEIASFENLKHTDILYVNEIYMRKKKKELRRQAYNSWKENALEQN